MTDTVDPQAQAAHCAVAQYDALVALYRLFGQIFMWDIPEYREGWPAKDRRSFAKLVESRELFASVEKAKRLLLSTGYRTPRDWNAMLYAALIQNSETIAPGNRNKIQAILREMIPELSRLRAAVKVQSMSKCVTIPPAPPESHRDGNITGYNTLE